MAGMNRHTFWKGAFFIFGVVLALGTQSFGQANSNLAYQLANVMEDVRLLDERLRLMNAELEEMRRENRDLRQRLASSQSDVDASLNKLVTIGQLNNAIAEAVGQLEKRDDRMKDEIVLQVGRQIQEFADKVNKAIGKLPAGGAAVKRNIKTNFEKNYPQEVGIVYTVKSGDTLNKIAEKFDSRWDWIQNANEIADPSRLQVGRELWIPVEE